MRTATGTGDTPTPTVGAGSHDHALPVPAAAGEALAAPDLRFQALVERLPLIVYVDRLDDRATNVYTSPQTAELLGYLPEEWAGNPDLFLEILHPDDRAGVVRAMEQIRSSGQDQVIEYRVVAADGRIVWLRDGGTVLRDEAGNPCLLQGYLLDISEQKEGELERSRLEEQMRQTTKMEAVGRLAGGIAHDFNNLLTAIQGYGELALSRLEPDDPQRRDLEEIQRAAERAAALTRQLLAFGRRRLLQPQAIDVNAVVSDIEMMLRRLIGEDVELVTDLDPELGTVRADAGHVEQVLMNLAVNARDAMRDGGRLEITTRSIDRAPKGIARELDLPPGPYVVLAVSDTGRGMAPEVQERIFEPFFTTKGAGEGTGLGLATVYGIVRQSGGHIAVESAPGKGSTFRIWLPVGGEPMERIEPPRPEPLPEAAETVLLVEDDESVRTMVCRVLEQQGYSVLEAATGEEALEIAVERGDEIDLVFTDVVMPGMGGVELVEHVRAIRPELEVIFMSGYAEGISRRGALDPTAPFLQKPFTPSTLAQVVRRTLERTAA
ncbi:MAG: ATP-binding protein [Gaiellales bacterium]